MEVTLGYRLYLRNRSGSSVQEFITSFANSGARVAPKPELLKNRHITNWPLARRKKASQNQKESWDVSLSGPPPRSARQLHYVIYKNCNLSVFTEISSHAEPGGADCWRNIPISPTTARAGVLSVIADKW